MLNYYCDCVFVVLSGNVVSWDFVSYALCVVWIVFFFYTQGYPQSFKHVIYCNQRLVKADMLLMKIMLDRWLSF
jgi:hypothetical protein